MLPMELGALGEGSPAATNPQTSGAIEETRRRRFVSPRAKQDTNPSAPLSACSGSSAQQTTRPSQSSAPHLQSWMLDGMHIQWCLSHIGGAETGSALLSRCKTVELAAACGAQILSDACRCRARLQFERHVSIIPVPCRSSTNTSTFARAVAGAIPMGEYDDCLVRQTDSLQMHQVPAPDRAALFAASRAPKHGHALLVDDDVVNGHTLRACAAALQRMRPDLTVECLTLGAATWGVVLTKGEAKPARETLGEAHYAMMKTVLNATDQGADAVQLSRGERRALIYEMRHMGKQRKGSYRGSCVQGRFVSGTSDAEMFERRGHKAKVDQGKCHNGHVQKSIDKTRETHGKGWFPEVQLWGLDSEEGETVGGFYRRVLEEEQTFVDAGFADPEVDMYNVMAVCGHFSPGRPRAPRLGFSHQA